MDKTETQGKILIVDDNPKNIQVIGTILRDAKYEIGFALGGRQALEILDNSPDYTLVLLDIKMPGMDGFEVCRIMKNDERLREIPVIFISASSDLDNIITAFEYGGVDYVTKPFNSKELLARVNTHVQLKQRTLEVQNYAREMEKLNATKDKFFSIIAHDLRNPFEGILLVTRNLLSNFSSFSGEEIRNQVSMIQAVTDSGYKLLENLLLWSRSQTGNIAFKPRELSLEPMILQCIDSVNPWAIAKHIEINYSSTELKVTTDEDMFCHILRNLLTNALKFTDEQGHITVLAEKAPGAIEVSVIDDGIGISASDLDHLFKIDGNIASRPGTRNESGSGLGLILCRDFLDKMGGTIRVKSEPGKGSRFTFSLPA